MSTTSALDRFQKQHPVVGFPLAVVYKFFDDQGNMLAALITYYAFVSLFPLLLLLVTILGYTLHGDPALQQQVLNSTLRQIPVLGTDIRSNIGSLHGSALALTVGIVGSLYGALGVAQAGQNTMNKIWAVPRNARPNPFAARAISIALLLVVGLGVFATTVLSALTTSRTIFGANLGGWLRILTTAGGVAINALLFLFAFRMLTSRELSVRQVAPGAMAAAVAWQALQQIGTYYLQRKLLGADATYGVFGIVLGLLAWIYFSAVTIILCAEANVVRTERLWPRSLLAPFSDNIRLTPGDRRAYESYPGTEKHKGFETVEVAFDQPPEPTERTAEH